MKIPMIFGNPFFWNQTRDLEQLHHHVP